MELMLIRHAATAGNKAKRYIGVTDEPVLRIDCVPSFYFNPEMVFCSPMLRCRQTAETLFNAVPHIIVDGFCECNFGDFEGKTYEDLKDVPAYQAWLGKNCESAPPNGEALTEVRERVLSGIKAISAIFTEKAACVVHGGTIMIIMQSLFGGSLFDWQVKNLDGYILRGIEGNWTEYLPLF